ncbi:hypothetical protein DID88_004841 [Monilinia fructigena]|uniref:Uncharacterized protein n=1 Tax=Monilinia fructigena TaxID=38457 RepID=A0A395IQX3_9HELO|nr:hypothetical protein DID88_004841 [Monilinia fructigena]
MATHEQKESTSSRSVLDSTTSTSTQEKSSQDTAPLRALDHQSERETAQNEKTPHHPHRHAQIRARHGADGTGESVARKGSSALTL